MGNVLSFASTKEIILVLAGVLVLVSAIFGYRAWRLSRVTPEERERRRRVALVARGKMGDATITEMRGELVFYSYDVRGVEYIASQDLTLLRDFLPADLSVLIGSVSVRYDPKNPANSIILAENWTGLRVHGKIEEVRAQRSKVKSPK